MKLNVLNIKLQSDQLYILNFLAGGVLLVELQSGVAVRPRPLAGLPLQLLLLLRPGREGAEVGAQRGQGRGQVRERAALRRDGQTQVGEGVTLRRALGLPHRALGTQRGQRHADVR